MQALLSQENNAVGAVRKSELDMSHPITDYWVASCIAEVVAVILVVVLVVEVVLVDVVAVQSH